MGNTDSWAALASQITAPPVTSAAAASAVPDPWEALAGQITPAPPSDAPKPQQDSWENLAAQTGMPTETQQPKAAPQGLAAKAWDMANTPLLDFTREGAGPIETGAEKFVSGLTTPASVALAAATLGTGALEGALGKLGYSAIEAAGIAQKAKLGADIGFLTKYGYDVGHNTLPQLEQNWGDYRAATNARDREKALGALKEYGTESILGAIVAGLATKGIASDIQGITSDSPKGQALAQQQYADSVYKLSEKKRTASGQADQIEHLIDKEVPSESRQAAIYHNYEALGDPETLEQRGARAEAAGNTKLAEEVRSAKELNDKEKTVRDQIRETLTADGNDLKAANRLPEDADSASYLPHRYAHEYLDPVTKKPAPGLSGGEGFLKKRVFDNIVDAELAGYAPIKNLAALIGDYHENAGNVLARDAFSETLAAGRTNEGAPMAAPQGLRRGGVLGAQDAPIDPEELEKLKQGGTLDSLISSGRIYRSSPDAPTETAVPSETVSHGIHTSAPGTARTIFDLEAKLVQRGIPQDRIGELRHAAMDLKDRMRDKRPWDDFYTDFLKRNAGGPGLVAEPAEPEYRWRQTDFEPSGAPYTVTGLNIWRDGQRIPLALNPEIAPHASALLEQSNPSRLAELALKASSGAKSSLVALSPFHWATMANRMLELVKNPLQRPQVDWNNLTPDQQSGLRDGLMIGGRNMGRVAEGIMPSKESVINKIPLVGGLNKLIEENLFGPSGYISGLKFDAYGTLKDSLAKSYPNLNDQQVGRIAASQVNNKFGGLNYDVLGRGANTQNALRLFLLAPDFLESTGRSVLDVAGDYGTPLLKRLVAFNVAQWFLARGVNYLVSGDTHPESGLAVRSKDGKREYSVRTTLGDFLHFAEKPLDFAANRVNPLGRAAAEDFYGVDQQGHRVSDTQKFFDTLRQITPIPLQGMYPNQQVSQPAAIDKFAQGMGVQSRKRFTPAETTASELASKREEGTPLEGDDLAKAQLRYKLEDQLRTAIVAHDTVGTVSAQNQIHAASSGSDAQFSGSQASTLIRNAHKFPTQLQGSVNRLGLEDALQVWDKAGLEERRELRPIIQKKIENWQLSSSKRTRGDNDSMRQRIQAFRFSLGG